MALVILAGSAAAQEQEAAPSQGPALPGPIQTLVDGGAQVAYLGNHNGLDGWITVRNGQEQYFYATPDGKSLMMGLLFDKDGELVTVRQVRTLQEKSGDVLGLFTQPVPEELKEKQPTTVKAAALESAFKTPSEHLYDNLQDSNWIALGDDKAPVIYMFIDPQCPHCKAFLGDLRKDYIEKGLLQVRAIPVGLRPQTKAQAAFLLAAPNPQERLFRYMDGDEKALPVTGGVNEQGVERNLAIMQSWKLDVTPLTVYRAADDQVKIVQGRAKNPAQIIKDLPAAGPAPASTP